MQILYLYHKFTITYNNIVHNTNINEREHSSYNSHHNYIIFCYTYTYTKLHYIYICNYINKINKFKY